MTRRSTLALPATGCVWASACTSARESSTGTINNRVYFHLRTCIISFPLHLSESRNAMDAQCSLPGRYFPYEFVPWAFIVRDLRALCISCPSNVKPEFLLYDHGRVVYAARDRQTPPLPWHDVRVP